MLNNTNVNKMVAEFIEKLILEAEMDKNVEKDVFDQLKKDLQERLENRINAVILSQIREDKLEEFEKLLDSGNEQEIQSFCSLNIPNLTELIASEFLNFRNRYIY